MELSLADFLRVFWMACAAALLAGVAYPLVGCFHYVRRTSFYGLALPQFAAAGVAFSFLVLQPWVEHVGLGGLDYVHALEDPHATLNYHFAWAAAFTLGGLGLLNLAGRAGGSETARVAAAFALAHAATLVFLDLSPTGDLRLDAILRGDAITVGVHELETLAVVALGGVALLALFRRDLLLVGYDRESALVLGKRVRAFELLLGLLTAASVAVGVMILGPVLVFGLFVVPPIAARRLARSMRAFHRWALAFLLDLSLGPSITAATIPWPLAAALATRRRAG